MTLLAGLAVVGPATAGIGDVDVRFASHGVLEIPDLEFGRVLQQPDGKLLALGLPRPSTVATNGVVELRRYTASGSPDTAFGVSGLQRVMLPVSGLVLGAVALQADGKIILAGSGGIGEASNRLYMARIDASGAVDATFGTGGVVDAGATGAEADGWGFGYTEVLALPNGDLVAMVDDPGSRHIDRFDDAGRQVSRTTLDGSPIAIASIGDDRVVLLRRGASGNVLSRLLRDGTMDPTFGSGGGVNLTSTDLMAVNPDSIAICGGGEWRRYTASGAADPTFGSDGLGRVPFLDIPGLAATRCDGLAITAEGLLVAILSDVRGTAQVSRVTNVVVLDADGRPHARVGEGKGFAALRGRAAPGTHWKGRPLILTLDGDARAVSQVASLTTPCLCIEAIDLGGHSARGAVGIPGKRIRVMEQSLEVDLSVVRSGQPAGAARVRYELVRETAAGDDLGALSGELFWVDGDAGTRTLRLPVVDDSYIEGEETVLVRLFDATGVDTPAEPFMVTIVDDDALRNLRFDETTITWRVGPSIPASAWPAWQLRHDGAALGPITAYFYLANGIDSCCVGVASWAGGERGVQRIYPEAGEALGNRFYVSLIDDDFNEAGPSASVEVVIDPTPPDNSTGGGNGGGSSGGGDSSSGGRSGGGGGAFGMLTALLLLGLRNAAQRQRCVSGSQSGF